MADIKISQLPNSPEVYSADLLEISKSLGGGNYASRKIAFSSIKESLVGKRTVTVSKNTGADANTIKDGLAIAASLSPSFINPVVVLVSAGYYTEVNPLVIPNNVSVISTSDIPATMVGFTTPNSNGFELGIKSVLRGFSLYAFVPNVTCVVFVGGYAEARDITIINGETGFLIENADLVGASKAINCNISLISTAPGVTSSCTTGFLIRNGSFLTIYTSNIWGLEDKYIGTGVAVEGANSGVDIYSTSLYACTNGYTQKDNCSNYMEAFSLGTCDYAITINGGSLFTTGVQITYSNINDIVISEPTAVVRFLGTADSSMFNIISGADFTAQIQDLNINSSGSRTIGQTISEARMVAGYPNAPNEGQDILFDVGEGSAYDIDKYGNEVVELWQYDPSLPSGNRFTRFVNNAGTQLASNGASIVVGSKFEFSALRINILTAANVGSNSIVAEYWDGAVWNTIGISAFSRDDFTLHANKCFQNRETQFVEHSTSIYNGTWYSDDDVLDQIPAWDNTFHMFAVRYRNVGNLINGMVFNSGKVKGDGYQISANTTKIITAWGKNRLTQSETVKASDYLVHSINPASSYSVDISLNTKSTIPNCKFTFGSKMAFCDLHYIQQYVDTSTPLLLQLDVVPLDSDPTFGNINFKVYVVILSRGQVLDGTASEAVYNITIPTYNIPNVILAGFASIDLSAYPTGTAIALTVERDANGGDYLDTYMGSCTAPLMIYNHTKKII